MAELSMYFLEVSTQVGVMFLLIAVGFILTHLKVINDKGAKQITDIVLYAVTPAVIIKAFISVEFSPENVGSMLIAVGSAIAVHFIGLFLGKIVFRKIEKPNRNMYISAVVFANGGYMSLPLAEAILGDYGAFLLSMFVTVFNVFIWTLGVHLFSTEKISAKKLILNPNIIAVIIGVVLFFCRIDITGLTLIYEPVVHFANLNAPLAMIVIGYYLRSADCRLNRKDTPMFLSIALRIIAMPLIMMTLLRLCGVTGDTLTCCVIPASAPIAAMLMMFATKFGGDTSTASKAVAVSHICSIVTMPLMLTLCRYIGQ